MTGLPDLASRLLGGGAVYANDEFYAPADSLVDPAPPSFTPATFGARGQVYDGWETRRRREPGFDQAIVRLGAPGVVHRVVIDTAHFTGNYPPYASVDGLGAEGYPAPAELLDAEWLPLVPRSPLQGNARNELTVDLPYRLTHVRLSIYPDGGVARLRVPGEVVPDPRLLCGGLVDLAALEYGGAIAECSDEFYGAPDNLIQPGLARTMGEGWETRRRRDGGNDWVVIRLAAPGRIRLAELDTSHFKGNAPGAVSLRGRNGDTGDWFPLLPERIPVQPDTRHRFPVIDARTATQVRLDVFPDGGLARLRLPGEIAAEDLTELGRRWWRLLPPEHARRVPEADALRYAG